MWDALKGVLIELAGSKKFLVFVATAIALGLAKLKWNVTADDVYPYLALVASYIVGQGVADHGKEAEKQRQLAAARAANDNDAAKKIAA